MKHRKILFIIFIAISFNSFSQYVNVGAQWYYGVPDQNGLGVETYSTYLCTKDTVISGDTYSKITFSNTKYGKVLSVNYFLIKQNNKIYYWSQNSKKILFDLNAKIGDTINLDLYLSQVTKYYSSNDSSVNVNVIISKITWIKNSLNANDSLKSFEFYYPKSNIGTSYFTQKVIHSMHGDNVSLLYLFGQGIIPEGSSYLRCYSDSSYNFHYVTSWNQRSCDYDNTGINETSKENELIEVFPNPANNEFTIQTKTTEKVNAQLFDITGKLILHESFIQHSTFNISNFQEGIYFLKITNSNFALMKMQKIVIVK